MKNFEKILYEALLVAFGKTLAKYNLLSQGVILRDVGKEMIDYLNKHGLQFEEQGEMEDITTLIELFVKNGFAEKLEIEPAAKGQNYIWHNLYGIEAYKELHDVADNPFLSCPLNLCLYYLADKHNKTMRLHRKIFDLEKGIAESQYEIIDKDSFQEESFDPLVVENVRLYELAQERADKLEKAQKEIKILRGIIPICSYCKKIRDDQGFWQQVETYITEHSEAMFSHGLCPSCLEELYPEYSKDE